MLGVDGCKYGWCVAHGVERPNIRLIQNISELCLLMPTKKVLIDMPIGLPDKDYGREVDTAARKLLRGKASSIFTIPCRQSVYASDYASANVLNRGELGKGLSIQAWNICKKIKEVDKFLLSGKSNIQFLEAHPELCFQFLNPSTSILPSKKIKAGQRDRAQILEYWHPGLKHIYESEQKKYFRREVQLDDILDAMCLWLVNYLSEKDKLHKVCQPAHDRKGIEMNIHFVNPLGYEI